jgi:hypothetical protein
MRFLARLPLDWLCAQLTLTSPLPFDHNLNDRASRYLRDTEVKLKF